MREKRHRRISAGTILMVMITAATLFIGGWVISLLIGNSRLSVSEVQGIISGVSGFFSAPDLVFSEDQTNDPAAAYDDMTLLAPLADMNDLTGEGDTPVIAVEAVMPSPPPSASLRITAAGSMLIDKKTANAYYASESQTYDFSTLFSYIRDEIASDVNLLTLENLIDPSAALSDLNTSLDLLSAIKDASFDIIALGFEKAMDLGINGLRRTLSAIHNDGFSVIGAFGQKEDAANPLMLTFDGVKVVFLHYTETLSEKSRAGIKRESAEFAVPQITYAKIANDIAKARKQGGNVIILSVHWGTINKSAPSKAQRTMAQRMAEAGADVIIGAHSQALQPIEMITVKRSDGTEKQTLVVYSLGALMTSRRETANLSAILLHLDLSYDPAADHVRFDNIGYTPIYFWRYRSDRQYIIKPVPATIITPEEMSLDESKAMDKAYKRVNELLANSPAAAR